MWVPPGEWILWQTGESHSGPQTINVQAKQTDIPVLVKAGAVLPLKTMASVSDIAPDPLVLLSLATLAVIYTCMGPWQLLWALETRRKVLVPYIVMEGVLCPLLEPIFLPQMIDTAMEDYEEEDAVDEHVTNYVTSLFQTAFNLGQVVGPFLGAYFIELYGFGGALIRWGGVFGVVSAGLTMRLLSRRGSGATGRRRRPTSGVGEAGVDGETRASEYEPRERGGK